MIYHDHHSVLRNLESLHEKMNSSVSLSMVCILVPGRIHPHARQRLAEPLWESASPSCGLSSLPAPLFSLRHLQLRVCWRTEGGPRRPVFLSLEAAKDLREFKSFSGSLERGWVKSWLLGRSWGHWNLTWRDWCVTFLITCNLLK